MSAEPGSEENIVTPLPSEIRISKFQLLFDFKKCIWTNEKRNRVYVMSSLRGIGNPSLNSESLTYHSETDAVFGRFVFASIPLQIPCDPRILPQMMYNTCLSLLRKEKLEIGKTCVFIKEPHLDISAQTKNVRFPFMFFYPDGNFSSRNFVNMLDHKERNPWYMSEVNKAKTMAEHLYKHLGPPSTLVAAFAFTIDHSLLQQIFIAGH